ncbi:MAG: ATP-binding cassette domain-containing protein, partial [Desulfobulbaceae bacterium]|nr:ATP-binding cassette domain-containing protein [Desulfobulbaceae bacterium]
MIEVRNLTKFFGTIKAVDNISFKVEKGEILGFLGPNGAGKTTTMRIITGFIPASSGTAIIGGHDITDDSLSARKMMGYLP